MTRVTIEVVRDASAPAGGRALLCLNGLFDIPSPTTFRIDLIDDDAMVGTARRGWPAGDLTPESVRLGEKGVEMLIGPDVVDAPLLLPGTPVEISVPGAGLRQELRWPSLPVSKVERRATVVVSGEQRTADIAARAQAQREELARITAARLEAERVEREAALAMLAAKRVPPAAQTARPAADALSAPTGRSSPSPGAAAALAAAAAAASAGIPRAEPAIAAGGASVAKVTPPPLPTGPAPFEAAPTPLEPQARAPTAAGTAAPVMPAVRSAIEITPLAPASAAVGDKPRPHAAASASSAAEIAEEAADRVSASAVLSRQNASRAAPRSSSATLQRSFGLGFLVASGMAIAASLLFSSPDVDSRRQSQDVARQLEIEAEALRKQVAAQIEARRQMELETSRKLAEAETERKRLLAQAAATASRAEAERQQRLAEAEAARKAAADADAASRAEAERQQQLAEAEAARKAAAEADAAKRAEAERQQQLAEAEAARKAAAEADTAKRAEAERQQKLAEAEAARKAAIAAAEASQRAEAVPQSKLDEVAAARRAQDSDAAHRREVDIYKSEAREVSASRQAEIVAATEARRRADAKTQQSATVAVQQRLEARAESAPKEPQVQAAETKVAALATPVTAASGVKPRVVSMPRAGGMAELSVRAPAHGGQRVSITYASLTLVRSLDASGSLDLLIDLIEGDGEAVVAFADGSSERTAVVSNDGARLQKVAIVWDSPVDLDLHALEYGSKVGSAGHIWSSAPGSGEAASAKTAASERSHGFLSTIDDGTGAGSKLEVYTIWLAEAQRGGFVSFAVDNVTRGDVPSGEHCGEGRLATVAFTVVRRSAEGVASREHVMLSSAPCGQPLGEQGRLNRTGIEGLRIRR